MSTSREKARLEELEEEGEEMAICKQKLIDLERMMLHWQEAKLAQQKDIDAEADSIFLEMMKLSKSGKKTDETFLEMMKLKRAKTMIA